MDKTYPYLASAYGSIEGVPKTETDDDVCSLEQDLIYYDTMPNVVNETNLTRYDNVTSD